MTKREHHSLRDVMEYGGDLGPPYFRWVCTCGTTGGQRATSSAALAAYVDHKPESP